MKMHSAIIPFAGFYYSMHDDIIDSVIDDELLTHDEIYFPTVFNDYAEMYSIGYKKWLEEEHGLSLPSMMFENLDAQPFYNYCTDRIFVHIDNHDLRKLYTHVMNNHRKAFISIIKDRFASRDGFISSYSTNINDWPSDVTKWDHNQIEALFLTLGADEREIIDLADVYEKIREIILDNLIEENEFA